MTIPADCRFRCAEARPFLSVPENQGAATTTLLRCPTCQLVFEDPRPSAAAIAAFYDDTRLWTDSTDAEGNRRSYVDELERKRPAFRELVRRIERLQPNGGRLLDVGCGPGLLQSVADAARWQITGVEQSRHIAELGRARLGAHILDGDFMTVALPGAPFDVVVMKYVLDHLQEPYQALRRARELVRPGGWLVVADLINIESFCARFFGRGHRLIHPMHFTYFSPRTIRSHLVRAGFVVRRVDFPFVRTPYFTTTNLFSFAGRVARRAWNLARGDDAVVYSPPFWGNMMDVFAEAV